MFTYIYDWMKNIAFYLVLITVLMQIIPNSDYKKYIRFFTGLILILLLCEPILGSFGLKQEFSELYRSIQYRQDVKEMEEASEYFRQAEEGYLEWSSKMDPRNGDKRQSADEE